MEINSKMFKILQIIIQQELERLTEYLKVKLILKIQNFRPKLEIITKLKKRIALGLAFLVMKTSKNIESLFQEVRSNMMIYYY